MSRPRDRGLDTIYRSYYPTVTGGGYSRSSRYSLDFYLWPCW